MFADLSTSSFTNRIFYLPSKLVALAGPQAALRNAAGVAAAAAGGLPAMLQRLILTDRQRQGQRTREQQQWSTYSVSAWLLAHPPWLVVVACVRAWHPQALALAVGAGTR